MSNYSQSCKIYYGDGSCSIEGNDIMGVTLRYTGDAILETRATNTRWVWQQPETILILSTDATPLTSLFVYAGTLKILSAEVANITSLVSTSLHRIENYSELINTKAEDLTINAEDLSIKKSTGIGQKPRSIKHPILEHQDTKTYNSKYYLENGKEYHGYFHVHFRDGSAMTGAVHTPESQLLYIKPFLKGKFMKRLVPTTTSEANKIRRLERNKMRGRKSMRSLRTRAAMRKRKDK